MADLSFTAYSRERYDVTIRPRTRGAEPPPLDTPGLDVRDYPPDQAPPPWHRLYDAATYTTTAFRSSRRHPNDLANLYKSMRLETHIGATVLELERLARTVMANTVTRPAPPPVLYSDRRQYATCWPFQATEEVDGFNVNLVFQSQTMRDRAGALVERLFPVQRLMSHSRAMVPPATQLQRAVEREPYVTDATRQAYERDLGRIRKLLSEKWQGISADRTQRDLVVAPGLPPGLYKLRLDCPFHYHKWRTWNEVDYKVTREPYSSAERVPSPLVAVGVSQHTKLDVFLVPRRHRYFFRYWVIYLFTVWLWYTFLYVPATGVFDDRLPWEPVPFTFTAAYDTAVNDGAVSRWVQVCQRYALSLVQDKAIEHVTPYSTILVWMRVEGLWTIREGALVAGDLAAIVDRHTYGSTERYYVWRMTAEPYEARLVDFGPLDTQEVVPMDRTGPMWNFTAHEHYGPI